jgi:hypothetical protein
MTKDLDASCICDVLNATCTPGCCCDPDCPAAAVAAFKAGDGCLPEGAPPQQLDYCVPDDSFAQARARTRPGSKPGAPRPPPRKRLRASARALFAAWPP